MLASGTINVNVVVGPHQRSKLSPAGQSLIGKTPAQLAAWYGHDRVLEHLLTSKASCDRNEDEIMSPLFAAIAGQSKNARKTGEVLITAGADVNEEDEDTEINALHQAIEAKRFDLVPWLIELNANRNDKDVRGFTPLAKAVNAGDTATVQLLLKKKVPPNTMSDAGTTPLSTSCKKGFVGIAEAVIDAGAPIDAEAYYQALLRAGYRPTAGTAESMNDKSEPDPALLEMLSRKGGFPGSQSKDGSIVLHVAACENNVAVAEMCINMHAERGDPPAKSYEAKTEDTQMTPLMLCGRHGSVGVAKKLLEAGADIAARDTDGNTPLHHTWWETGGRIIHNARMYEFLVEKGGDKDATNDAGYKPELPEDGNCPMM